MNNIDKEKGNAFMDSRVNLILLSKEELKLWIYSSVELEKRLNYSLVL